MNDLISRQAAMAYPLSWEHYDMEHGDRKFICGVESYREYIEHLQSVDEWIPCSERLPKKYGWYQVTTSDKEVACRWYSDLHGWETFDDAVIAWLPRPEPYKGGAV